MEELERWEIEAPLREGSYIWQAREFDHLQGWSEWEPVMVFIIVDEDMIGLGPSSEWAGGVLQEYKHYLQNWELAQAAKNREGRPFEKKSLRDLLEYGAVNVGYRLVRATDDEAYQASDILFQKEAEAPPKVGDWFILVVDDPTTDTEYSDGVYGKIVAIEEDWRVVFKVLGVRQKPNLVTTEEVFEVDPETLKTDRSKPIRKLGQIKLGGLYSYWTDDPETMLFGGRESREEEVRSFRRRRGDWKHLSAGR